MDDQGTSVASPAPAISPAPRASRLAETRRFPWLLVGLIVVGLGGGGAAYFLQTEEGRKAGAVEGRGVGGEGEKSGKKADDGLAVDAVHPHPGGVVRTTSQAGSVHAFESAALFSKVSGYLKEQGVDIGDRVKLGQLLVVIDDPEVDKAVEQNQASLDHAQAKVKVAQAKIRSAEAAREASQALVKQAETMVTAKLSNEELQKKQLTRIAGLVARNAVEDKLQDEQQDRADVAIADVGVARAEVLSAKADVMNKTALVEEAQADLSEARANVEVARTNLSRAQVIQEYTRITSPYDGVVTLRSFHRGDFIRSASEGVAVPVLAVARTDLMRVVVPVPDKDVPFVDKGDQAAIRIDALPGRTFEGKVARFSYTEDPSSRNMRTEVDLPNPDGKLHEGMYGRITITLQAASAEGVTIPSSALIRVSGQGEGVVYVVKDGKAHKVDVRVGNDNGVESEILKGLATDDQVITSYNGTVEEGTPVHAQQKKSAQPAH